MGTNTRVTAKLNGKSILITQGSVHALDALAKSLGYKDHTAFDCYQGGWRGSSSYSGNTHGREAFDLSASQWREKVYNARRLGIWLDHRLTSEGDWDEHIHGARLEPGADYLDPSMSGQQRQYLEGDNGLVNDHNDDDPRPRYPNVRFVDNGVHERWIATKPTQGYNQAGGHANDKRGDVRPKGYVTANENIATVRLNGVDWLVFESMTFFRRSDFDVYRKQSVTPKPIVSKPKPKPAKPARRVLPWFNVSFQNTHWNSVVGGKAVAVAKTTEPLVKVSTSGSPAIATFSEVRPSQISTLNQAMKAAGYKLVAYVESNMLAAYARKDVVVLGHSFAKFSKQDGGNVEGVLRVKFRVDGSRAQVGVIHLDVDASLSKKRSNVKEAYKFLRRYGIATLLPDWKSRTTLIGDWNHPDVAAEVLRPLGFKQLDTGDARIDQAFVGARRPDRGGAATRSTSDHKRIVARLGRY